ncbi:MAG: hypothetical protein KAS23_11915, partial [Anaerohalosphaera sp.]|nr:hypothetical protein [Anaerohalosphaera sp.]
WHRLQIHTPHRTIPAAYPNFKMPIDIRISSATGTKVLTAWLEHDIQWYTFPTRTEIIDVKFDEDNWILRPSAAATTYTHQSADINLDGEVNNADLAILADAWQTNIGHPLYNPAADIATPKDNNINIADLQTFTTQWLQSTQLQ